MFSYSFKEIYFDFFSLNHSEVSNVPAWHRLNELLGAFHWMFSHQSKMYVDSRDVYSECNLRTTCAVAPLYLLTELILTYFRLTSFAIYQSRWFQCELLSCGDKRLQRCEYNRKRWQRFQPYHRAERSYTFKGALRHNFLQLKCINHILFAVCERIVTWCEKWALRPGICLILNAARL